MAKSSNKRAKRQHDSTQTPFDRGSRSVQEIHRSISDLPFEILDRLGVLQKSGGEIKKIHDETVNAIYDTVREVATKISDFAAEVGDEIVGPAQRDSSKSGTA